MGRVDNKVAITLDTLANPLMRHTGFYSWLLKNPDL